MRIYRRPGSKIWWCQYQGERFSLKTTDEQAASLKFAELQRRVADPTYRPPDPTATRGRFLTDYVAQQTQKGRAQGTLDMYGVHVAHLARVLGQHTLLAHLGAEELDGYVAQRHEEGAAESTIYKECNTLGGALKLARRHRKYPYALDEVMPTVCGASPAGKTHLVREEVVKLMAVLTPKRAAVVAFIVATAADWRSVAAAVPEDFDPKGKSILVRGTKNENRWRTIPILEPFKDLAEIAAAAVPFEHGAVFGGISQSLASARRSPRSRPGIYVAAMAASCVRWASSRT